MLLDVLTEDPVWGPWSTERSVECAATGSLVINQIVHAEVPTDVARIDDLHTTVPDVQGERDQLT